MKSSIIAALIVSGALVFALNAQAQQAAPKEHSMTGCLAKGTEAGTYMVTNVEGTGPKTIGIVSSTASLAPSEPICMYKTCASSKLHRLGDS